MYRCEKRGKEVNLSLKVKKIKRKEEIIMKKSVLKIILAGFLILFVGYGISSAAEPGLTKDSIKIGWFCPLSGPFQSYGLEPWRAATMWYDKVNKDGGIHGRKLNVIVEDDKCMGADLVAAVKKLVTKEEVFILNGGCCTAAIVSAQEYIERLKIPLVMVVASGDQSLYPPSKYIFGGFSISQYAAGGSMIDFVKKYLKAKRIAWITHSDEYGRCSLEGAEYQLKKEHPGVTFATVERIDREITDVTSVALKVKNSNPDVVCFMTFDRPTTLLIKSMYDMGVKCTIILSPQAATNLYGITKAVGVKEAFQDCYIQEVLPYSADGLPGPEWARKMYAEYYPDMAKLPGHPLPRMFNGLNSAKIVCKGLEDAGPEPTREKVLKAIENIRLFDTKGLTPDPISFGPDKHAAVESTVYLKFDGEKLTPIPGSYKSIWKWEGKK